MHSSQRRYVHFADIEGIMGTCSSQTRWKEKVRHSSSSEDRMRDIINTLHMEQQEKWWMKFRDFAPSVPGHTRNCNKSAVDTKISRHLELLRRCIYAIRDRNTDVLFLDNFRQGVQTL